SLHDALPIYPCSNAVQFIKGFIHFCKFFLCDITTFDSDRIKFPGVYHPYIDGQCFQIIFCQDLISLLFVQLIVDFLCELILGDITAYEKYHLLTHDGSMLPRVLADDEILLVPERNRFSIHIYVAAQFDSKIHDFIRFHIPVSREINGALGFVPNQQITVAVIYFTTRHTLVDFDVLRILHFFLVGVPFDNLEIAKPEDECKTEQEYYDQDYIDPGLQYLSVYGFKAFYFSSFQYNSILFHISICKAILS